MGKIKKFETVNLNVTNTWRRKEEIMKHGGNIIKTLLLFSIFLFLVGILGYAKPAPAATCAYIYNTDISKAQDFAAFLTNAGHTTTLVSISNVLITDFSVYDLIIIGSDTGHLGTWGTPASVSQVANSGRPIIGLGEGGYAFFGKLNLAIGYANGWHGADPGISVVDPSHQIFNFPIKIPIPSPPTFALYNSTINVGINVPSPIPDVTLLGMESLDSSLSHYSLIQEETRYILWGFTGGPSAMTPVGKDLFSNIVAYMTGFSPGLIDPWKWADLEFITRIEGGALRSEARSSFNNPNIGNNLTFIDPNNVTSIKADVTVTDLLYNGDFPRARIHGFFYDDALGHVRAEVAIGNFGGGLRARYSVGRCSDFNCTTGYSEVNSGLLGGILGLGTTHNLFISWNGAKFDFALDSSTTASFTPTVSPPLASPIPFKAIGTHVTSGLGGFVSALFDNVNVKYNSDPSTWVEYDNFDSSTLIDRTKWKHYTQEINQALEVVREQVADGVFGSALRSYGSLANNHMNFINAKDVKEFQADLIVKEFDNTQAWPQARLMGDFYSYGNGTLDIHAATGIRHNGTQPVGFYSIVRCTVPDCNLDSEFVVIKYQEYPDPIGPDLVGRPHRLSIRWNELSNKFTFGFDERLTTYPSPSDSPLPAYFGPPERARKGIGTRISGIGGSSEGGYVSAMFWNIATVVDTDGDGIPDASDNCPAIYNPDQRTAACHDSPPPAGTPGIVCDPDPMCAPPGREPTGSVIVAPSADGEIYVDVTVTLKSISDILATPYVKPNPENVVIRVYDSSGNEIIADHVLCGPPCALPDDLVYIPTGSSQDYSTTIPLTRWFTNLQPGTFSVKAEYVNFCNTSATLKTTCLDPNEECMTVPVDSGGIYQGQQDLGEQPFTLASNKTVDQCPNYSEDVGGTGCPYADKNIVTLHKVNLGGGPSTKEPLKLAVVRVFDRNNSDFLTVAGKSNPDGSKYGIIFEANKGFVGECVSDSNGVCYVGERTKGYYLVIVKYYDPDTEKTVYVGRPKDPSDFNSSGIATKEFQIMKVFKKDVFQEYRGGSKMVVMGSILEIIAPESAVWEGVSSIYPFIFTSDSDWSVDVCASVPTGYEIVGVYDANGNLVESSECVQTFVSGEAKAVAFEVVEIGSPEPSLDTTLTMVSPKGKKQIKALKAQDIRRKSFDDELGKAKGKFKR
jgi:hypothetical protein